MEHGNRYLLHEILVQQHSIPAHFVMQFASAFPMLFPLLILLIQIEIEIDEYIFSCRGTERFPFGKNNNKNAHVVGNTMSIRNGNLMDVNQSTFFFLSPLSVSLSPSSPLIHSR